MKRSAAPMVMRSPAFPWLPLVLAAFLCFAGTGRVLAGSCAAAECHGEIAVPEGPHLTLAAEPCQLCHTATGEHPAAGGMELTGEGAALCYQCHESLDGKENVHFPVGEGDCLSCHDPHRPQMNLADTGELELCSACHDPTAFSRKFLHGPAAVGDCTACHDPHQSDQAALLRKPSQDICLSCHTDFAAGLAESPVVHTAVEQMGCTACHDPHSAPNASLLQQPILELCAECHEIAENFKNVETPHAALYRERHCGECHATHYSEREGLLPRSQQEVCLGCHGEDDFSKSDALRNIRTAMEGKGVLHGPVSDGDCAACHNPHGSEHFRMLRGDYPENFYVPYREGTYEFCLQCHEGNLLRFEETTIYTEFRNGKRNLHYVHVADSRKGRTCRACHAPHASDGSRLIRSEGTPFGDWRIPIRFQKTETGGSCAPGCHAPLSYSRQNPVEN